MQSAYRVPVTIERSHVAVLVCAYGGPVAGAYYIISHQCVDVHLPAVYSFCEPEKLVFV